MTTATLAAVTLLSGCSSINMPDLSDIAAPFRSDVADIDDRPKLAEAPLPPTDDRSSAQWDQAAKELIAERDALEPPEGVPSLSPAELQRDFNALQAEVNAYKADDPQ